MFALGPIALSSALLLQAGAASPARGTPAECAALEGPHAGNVWERAKAPALRRYCDRLASGATKLAGSDGMANQVLAIADEAERLLPGRAGPALLRGRAWVKLGRHAEAYAALKDAQARDPRALDEPAALLAWARAAARTQHLDEARAAYRALLPRASVLRPVDRGAAYVEAGFLAMAQGPAGLEEAVSIFRQARYDAQDAVQPVAVVALALALDRAGARDEATAILAERGKRDPLPMLAEARARQVLPPAVLDAELEALAAIAWESSDPVKAKEAWRRYVQAAKSGPWLEHARQREASGGGKRSAKEPKEKVP